MKLTTAQIFNIGTIVLGAVLGIWAILDPARGQVIGAISAIIIPAWGGIGTALTKPSDQVAAVINRIDTPAVAAPVAQALSQLPGVKAVNIDLEKASPALITLAASTAPENLKITHT